KEAPTLAGVSLRGRIKSLKPLATLPKLQQITFGSDLSARLPRAELSEEALFDLAKLEAIHSIDLHLDDEPEINLLRSICSLSNLNSLKIYGRYVGWLADRPKSRMSMTASEVISSNSGLRELGLLDCELPKAILAPI